jgi:hypothetical protein
VSVVEEVIEVKDIRELTQMIMDMPDGVMLEVELGEEEADDRREGI